MSNTYYNAAVNFCKSTGTTITAEYQYTGSMAFDDNKAIRDIYAVTIERNGKKWVFPYGQSIIHSGKYLAQTKVSKKGHGYYYKTIGFSHSQDGVVYLIENNGLTESSASIIKRSNFIVGSYATGVNSKVFVRNKEFRTPNAYDVLAAITKHDPETFEDFCYDYGYDTDSRKAVDTYFAVQKEYRDCYNMFGDVMDDLSEIN